MDDHQTPNRPLHLLLLVCTGFILRRRDVLLQYVPQRLHQPFMVVLHFLDFRLGVLQYTVEHTQNCIIFPLSIFLLHFTLCVSAYVLLIVLMCLCMFSLMPSTCQRCRWKLDFVAKSGTFTWLMLHYVNVRRPFLDKINMLCCPPAETHLKTWTPLVQCDFAMTLTFALIISPFPFEAVRRGLWQLSAPASSPPTTSVHFK